MRPNAGNAAPGRSTAKDGQARKNKTKTKPSKPKGPKNKKGLQLVHGAGPAPSKPKKKSKGKGKGNGGQTGVCFHWQQTGKCPYGETCRYEHGQTPSAPAQVKARKFAKDRGFHYYEEK